MFFAYHTRSKPTGERLAAILQMPHGMNPEAAADRSLLIRWGNRVGNEWLDGQFEKTINWTTSIERCSNKLVSLYLMSDEEINVPAWNEDPYELIEEYGYPILGRRLRHARGTDIKLILQERDLRRCNSDYFTVHIPTKREFRIHVVGDKVIRVQGKYLDFPNSFPMYQPYIRNYATGYRFRAPRKRLKPERLEMAVAAVKCLGLDFGAVDLLIGDDDCSYVLEVNTAPSCSPLTLAAYAVALQELGNIPNEIDMSVVDMMDRSIEDMDSDDEE